MDSEMVPPSIVRMSYPDSLPARSDHAQFRDVHFYYGSFSHHAQLCVHGRLRIFLDSDDW